MLKKVAVVVLCSAASLAFAEPQRVFLTTENKFPELHQLEVGAQFQKREFDDLNYRTYSAQARFGLVENLTARLDVPYVSRDEDFGHDTDGLGDIDLGFDLLAYEDIFGYPYVIPHVDIKFATGDEDEGLGTGDTAYSFGLSVGTVVYDVLHWVGDVTYANNFDAKASEDQDAFAASLSIIWDISDRFAVSAEGRMYDYQDASGQPRVLGGGLSYKWTPDFQTSFFFGGWQESPVDEQQQMAFRAAYQF